MQYRGFIQFALLILVAGCYVLGMMTTIVLLLVFALAVEIIAWSKLLEQESDVNCEGNSL